MEPRDGMVALNRLATGQRAEVRRIFGQPDQVQRLQEFGLRRGIEVEMFRSGNPCIVRLGCHKFCLRVDDLLNVLVQPAGT